MLRWDLFRNYALAGISLRAKTPLHGNTIKKRVVRRVISWTENPMFDLREEVEKCKDRDLLENMLAEMAGEFPALSRYCWIE